MESVKTSSRYALPTEDSKDVYSKQEGCKEDQSTLKTMCT